MSRQWWQKMRVNTLSLASLYNPANEEKSGCTFSSRSSTNFYKTNGSSFLTLRSLVLISSQWSIRTSSWSLEWHRHEVCCSMAPLAVARPSWQRLLQMNARPTLSPSRVLSYSPCGLERVRPTSAMFSTRYRVQSWRGVCHQLFVLVSKVIHKPGIPWKSPIQVLTSATSLSLNPDKSGQVLPSVRSSHPQKKNEKVKEVRMSSHFILKF